MNINLLLDNCREVCGVRTDIELAAKLRVSKQAVSGWRNGHRLPDVVTCATIAGLTGKPLGQVIGVVQEARAISPKEKAVWRRLATAAAVFLAVGLVVPTDAIARTTTGVSGSPGYALCEVARRLMEWLQAGLCSLLDRSQGKYRHGTSTMLA